MAFLASTNLKEYAFYNMDENTNNAPFPSILFICPTESIKKHISMYAKTLHEKNYEANISFFLTKKTMLYFGEKDNIWQKV